MDGNQVTGVDTNKGHFDLDVLVDATGPWAPFFGEKVGLHLPSSTPRPRSLSSNRRRAWAIRSPCH